MTRYIRPASRRVKRVGRIAGDDLPRLWDRAAALPALVDGRRLPAVVALPSGLPSVAELFEFMRDAELRFATLRLRIEERAHTTRGEDTTTIDVALRHPGEAKVTTTHEGHAGKADYEVWISDGEMVRTYAAAHKLGTQRPVRNLPAACTIPTSRGPRRSTSRSRRCRRRRCPTRSSIPPGSARTCWPAGAAR